MRLHGIRARCGEAHPDFPSLLDIISGPGNLAFFATQALIVALNKHVLDRSVTLITILNFHHLCAQDLPDRHLHELSVSFLIQAAQRRASPGTADPEGLFL